MRHHTLLHRIVTTSALAIMTLSGTAAGVEVAGHEPAPSAEVTAAAGQEVQLVPDPGSIVTAPSPADAATGSGTADRATPGPTAADDAGDREARDRRARQREARRITALQERLAELGWYRGEVDGVAGPSTTRAVRGFQRAEGLAVDGIAGERTMAALGSPDATTRAEWEARQPAPTTTSTSGADPTPTSTTSPNEPDPSSQPSSTSCDLSCRGDRILQRNPLAVPSGWSVTFEPGRDGYLGMAHGPPRSEIVIWVRDSHTDDQVGATLLHEIGHAYDFMGLGGHGDDGRQQWAQARGFEWRGQDAWFGRGCNNCTDFSIGAGDLAESVHACWAPGWDSFRSKMAGPPTASQCSLLRDLLL